MALITINDVQESESFLTELNHTDVAMDQINGGDCKPKGWNPCDWVWNECLGWVLKSNPKKDPCC
ncbi:hypothetical protein BJP37_19135 [Moorena bouillonii PNG]|uniref:Uncharacterized protein n=1 Tax=Moorena bouillonii PNG TaxID=568701 RepID=A0A1U7N4H2_9CYAN|nr:hypothetical protein BJP37_19135 [Moorena bouillonii PNG]